MNYLYHLDVVDELKRELALARASSDYWRAKYIAKESWDDLLKNVTSKARNRNSLYWFERAARSPMDECDE